MSVAKLIGNRVQTHLGFPSQQRKHSHGHERSNPEPLTLQDAATSLFLETVFRRHPNRLGGLLTSISRLFDCVSHSD